jgi:hypothetical protein
MKQFVFHQLIFCIILGKLSAQNPDFNSGFSPEFKLIPADKIKFNSFVDCNMAEAWIGDTFRIFPGKYGEDPVWGIGLELRYADGRNAEEVFMSPAENFKEPDLPLNAKPGMPGLHGAVWIETVYQDPKDKSGKTLYGIYHNENYPQTLPFHPKTGEGYTEDKWPSGLRGPKSVAAVPRIGVLKSTDGGKSWKDRGIFIEDRNSRIIRKPYNTSQTFAGGVGDPSAVASGDHLFLFYGEYSYPGIYNEKTYDPKTEWSGQCISVARIPIKDLENPVGKARRWDGKGFNAAFNGIGKPVQSLQIPYGDGGGPASSAEGGFNWGPSVSWNTHLECWVMVFGRVVGPKWIGSQVFISFNQHKDLNFGTNSQDWSPPQLLFEKPGYTLWYPSLQPLNTEEDIQNKYTCLRLGKRARFFVKRIKPYDDEYASEHIIEFER